MGGIGKYEPWFIIDESRCKITSPKLEDSPHKDKFYQIAEKDVLSADDYDWLEQHGLVDEMVMAKGGTIKAMMRVSNN